MYKIVQIVDGEFVVTKTEDIVAWAGGACVQITGTNSNKAHRAELQGQPKLFGFCGPLWDGNGVIRYENIEAYKILSS